MDALDKWLIYAQDVLGPTRCGSPCSLRPEQSAWPGFLGPQYARSRTLFVGAIHNENRFYDEVTDGLVPLRSSLENLEALGCAWAGSRKSARYTSDDDEYLLSMWETYPVALEAWARKGVIGNLRDIRNELAIESWDHIAFTNLAKCMTVRSGDDQIVQCLGRFSFSKLVLDLDPIAVFIAKDTNNGPRPFVPGEDEGSRLIVRFSNDSFATMGRSSIPFGLKIKTAKSGRITMSEWIGPVRERYADLRVAYGI